MFDDYRYKNEKTRIKIKFKQVKDEPLYPWEIASFLNKFNTSYYKFELLNSITSALEHGISGKDIFILNHSLPLYERYSELNLVEESHAAKLFYPIGIPIPLEPSLESYDFQFILIAFKTVNSFLKRNHIQPMRLELISQAYRKLQEEGLSTAEEYIIENASKKAIDSYYAALERGEQKNYIQPQEIQDCLEKYQKRKSTILNDLEIIESLDDEQKTK